jgi:4a-hydroxytetrahydrobiopterin dehydratase
MRPSRLTSKKVEAALKKLPGWALRRGHLHRRFRFRDFSEAFGFMARAALEAEKLGHHPDWKNSWNVVDVELTTHAAGGLTSKDVALARALSEIAGPI